MSHSRSQDIQFHIFEFRIFRYKVTAPKCHRFPIDLSHLGYILDYIKQIYILLNRNSCNTVHAVKN